MSARLLQALLELTLAMSAGILVVALLRKPVRRLAGARAAYWLWLLIPACMLAVSIPAPEIAPTFITLHFSAVTNAPLSVTAAVSQDSMHIAPWLLALWLVGGLLMVAIAFKRQRAFMLYIGELASSIDGTLRSRNVTSPMLIGVWRPRIVLPADFELQYEPEERALVLAHEEAHRRRRDAHANAVATLGVCAFWPNPLVHWAIGRFRFDQELACDALVLSGNERGRRPYADALLKAQLATQDTPAACHWQSAHPLKERVAMLKNPLPGRVQRVTGIAAILTVIGLSSYSVWAMQPGDTKQPLVADENPHFTFYADEVTKDADGAWTLNGHITLKPLAGFPAPISVSADTAQPDQEGNTVLEGHVVIKLGDRTVSGERAVRTPDGTIHMDSARSADLFAEGDAANRSSANQSPSADPEQNAPAVVSAVDLSRWFPEAAAKEGIEGNVTITVLLDEHGRPTDTRIVSESPAGYGFAAAASTAAHFFQYRNPTGAPAELNVNIKFALDQSQG